MTNTKPVIIIGGFLGAGKTTYINSLIEQGKVARTGLILVNDFGNINIDYELLNKDQNNVVQLSNGCICCSLRGNLADQLYQLENEDWFENITEVYIETSGVSYPQPILDTIKLSRTLTLKEWVTLVDMSQALRWYQDVMVTDLWQQQIRLADRLVLNRNQTTEANTLIDYLRDPTCKIRNLQIDTLIAEQKKQRSTKDQHKVAIHPHARVTSMHNHRVITATFTHVQMKNQELLAQYCHRYSAVILRAKGLIIIDEQPFLVQVSGNQVHWYTPPKDLSNQLVLIGKKSAQFEQLISLLNQHAQINT